ncbi:NAD(P)-dependent oxidoreductase, partial [Legionella brunensis]
MAQIGFVGLGHMGLPMAINLLKAGHAVTGFDVQQQALTNLANAGGKIAQNLQEAALNQDVIITMLQTGQQVHQVCLGNEGLFAIAKPNTLHIDCSSIDVASSREVQQQATLKQLLAIDAPVSGG